MTDDRRSDRWLWVAIFAILLIGLVTLVGVALATVASQQGLTTTERQDCARQISAEQNATRDAATIADRASKRADSRATNFYFDAVLNATVTRAQVTPAQIDRFTELLHTGEELTALADKADKAVLELPDSAKEVERQCPG